MLEQGGYSEEINLKDLEKKSFEEIIKALQKYSAPVIAKTFELQRKTKVQMGFEFSNEFFQICKEVGVPCSVVLFAFALKVVEELNNGLIGLEVKLEPINSQSKVFIDGALTDLINRDPLVLNFIIRFADGGLPVYLDVVLNKNIGLVFFIHHRHTKNYDGTKLVQEQMCFSFPNC